MRPPPGFPLLLFLMLALCAQAALAQAPALRYDPPAGFFGGGGDPPETWTSNNVDGAITIYPFQPFGGDFQGHFAQTLFGERIAQNRETRIVRPPYGGAVVVPGADSAMLLRFVADHSGYVREHGRLAVLARGQVAVIDISSSSPEAWTRNWPGALGLLNSLSVLKETPRPVAAVPVAGPVGEVAGLYLGSTLVFQANPMGSVGSGRWVPGTKWYLLSGDGRVQSGFKLPQAPNGDIRLFDYDAAKRKDPGFGGAYSVEGGQVTLRLGNETVVADLTPEGNLVIRGTTYAKSKLKDP
jgi:hypothetical protein